MRIMRVTGLVVFVAAVFLTFVGSNQLISEKSNGEAQNQMESAVVMGTNATIPGDNTAQNPGAEDSAESGAAEAATSGKQGARSKSRSSRRNSSQFGVWENHNGGKWVVETKWDGEKWVTKRVYYPSNKQ